MTREEKCNFAIEKGYSYDPTTGFIKNKKGEIITGKDSDGYITFSVYFDRRNKVMLKGHQFGWYFIHNSFPKCIDHINGIRNDNKLNNLRGITNQENLFNNKEAKGFYFNKRENKFRANIVLNKKSIHLGYFNTEEEARQAYLNAKEIYHKIV